MNFWGITFPRAVGSETPPTSALLQCRKCQTTALLNISLVEADVLETAGILSWPCDSCREVTPWGYETNTRRRNWAVSPLPTSLLPRTFTFANTVAFPSKSP